MKKHWKSIKMNIYDFKNFLIKKEPHALVRFGDGEQNIFDDVNCHRKGFSFDKEVDQRMKNDLIASHDYMASNYYMADGECISACLFVNENYKTFMTELVPLFNLYNVIFVGHENSNINNLPFQVNEFFAVSNNAWRFYPTLHLDIFKSLKKYKEDCLVLFACGPYSNILIYRLWSAFKKHHIFLNIGSTFDPFIFGQNTRQYHERLFKNDN
jgi:hypothetical protein